MTTTPNKTTDVSYEGDAETTGTHKLEMADTTPMVTPPPPDATVAERDDTSTARSSSYMQQDAKQEIDQRWQQVQSEFVDDPRKSVSHAHQLVSDTVKRIVDTFTQERNQLEKQWSEGEDVSTEDLRVCLHRYREFFSRLVPLEDAAK